MTIAPSLSWNGFFFCRGQIRPSLALQPATPGEEKPVAHTKSFLPSHKQKTTEKKRHNENSKETNKRPLAVARLERPKKAMAFFDSFSLTTSPRPELEAAIPFLI